MTVLENRDEWETSNVDVAGGLVTAYAKGDPPGSHRFIDYGMLLFRRIAFDAVPRAGAADLGTVIGPLVARGDRRLRRTGAVPRRRYRDGMARDRRLVPGAWALA